MQDYVVRLTQSGADVNDFLNIFAQTFGEKLSIFTQITVTAI
jgi:hypothetical protein